MRRDLRFNDPGPGGRTSVERAPFSIYVVDPELAYERSVSRWGATSHEDGDSEITEVAFLHQIRAGGSTGGITVWSSIDDAQSTDSMDAGTGFELDDAHATRAVEAVVRGLTALLWNKAQLDLDWEVSSEAQDLRRDQMLHEAEDRAAQSDTSIVEIPVDNKVVRFALARDRTGACCAAARIGLVWIQITSEQPLPADLRLLTVSGTAGWK
jgi:hypothetical protein